MGILNLQVNDQEMTNFCNLYSLQSVILWPIIVNLGKILLIHSNTSQYKKVYC